MTICSEHRDFCTKTEGAKRGEMRQVLIKWKCKWTKGRIVGVEPEAFLGVKVSRRLVTQFAKYFATKKHKRSLLSASLVATKRLRHFFWKRARTNQRNSRRAHAPLQPLLLFFLLNFMLIGVYVWYELKKGEAIIASLRVLQCKKCASVAKLILTFLYFSRDERW